MPAILPYARKNTVRSKFNLPGPLLVRRHEFDNLLEVCALLDELHAPPRLLGDLVRSLLQEGVAWLGPGFG